MENTNNQVESTGVDGLMHEAQAMEAAEGSTMTSSTSEQLEFNSDATEDAIKQAEEGNAEEAEGNPEGTEDSNDDSSGSDGTGDEELQEEVNKHAEATNEVKEALSKKGVDFDKVAEEYMSKGELSKGTVEKLNKAGYPNSVIEAFIAGRQALENRYTDAVYRNAGGANEYNRVIEWAKSNIPTETLKAYNNAIDANNLSAVNLMFDGMKAKMNASLGTSNKSIHGGAGVKRYATITGFTSKAEIIEAMSNPKYGRDAGYTREVEQKMLNTNF